MIICFEDKLDNLDKVGKNKLFYCLGVSFYAGLWLFGKQVRGSHMITS